MDLHQAWNEYTLKSKLCSMILERNDIILQKFEDRSYQKISRAEVNYFSKTIILVYLLPICNHWYHPAFLSFLCLTMDPSTQQTQLPCPYKHPSTCPGSQPKLLVLVFPKTPANDLFSMALNICNAFPELNKIAFFKGICAFKKENTLLPICIN